MKEKTKNIFKSKKGITLIALVVTIVVLLILAAVSIAMLGGENGIITQAQKAKEENIIAEEKEAITLAIAAIKTRLENVNKDNLKEEIEKIKKKESVEVTEIGENLLEVKYDKTGNVYNVNKDGELIDLETKLNASYEFYSDTNELYIEPYIENLEEIFKVMTPEEWIKSLETAMSKEEKEKIFLDSINIGTGSSYKTIDEFLEDTGSSSVDEFIQNEAGTEGITNLDEYIYAIGYEGMVIIENPDGSLNYGRIESPTENGYPAETGETYTFKIRFMGIEIEKTIKAQDLSDWEWEVNDDGKTVTITKYKGQDTTIIIPDEIYGMKVTEIGTGEGYYASGIASYESLWDNSICKLTNLGCGSVYTQSTITKVVIPEGIIKINDGAFAYSYALEEIQLPSTVNNIGQFTFYSCSSLTSINIPDSVTTIGDRAFHNCSSLTSINIPNSVTSIGESAFEGCSSLISINIPTSVTSIGDYAFSNCSSLTNINIPDSVTGMGKYAFNSCSSLTTINLEATTIPETWDSNWKGDCTATVNTGVKMD